MEAMSAEQQDRHLPICGIVFKIKSIKTAVSEHGKMPDMTQKLKKMQERRLKNLARKPLHILNIG